MKRVSKNATSLTGQAVTNDNELLSPVTATKAPVVAPFRISYRRSDENHSFLFVSILTFCLGFIS